MSLARAQTLESSAVTMRPPCGLNLTSLGRLTCQSNEKADKQIEMVDLQFADFPFVLPGPVRKEMQFRQPGDFSKIDVSTLSPSDINISGSFLFIYKSHFAETIFSTILYVPYTWLTFV